MKAFTTVLVLVASATYSKAQGPTFNETTGRFSCPADQPNSNFCAGNSLESNIIIRCTNGTGYPGNCNDNLSGYFPFGVNYAPCWQTSATSGDAACSKNCIVEAANPFTLPDCIPLVASPLPSSVSSSVTPTVTYGPCTSGTVACTSVVPGNATTTATGTATFLTGTVTTTTTFTTTFCPSSTITYPPAVVDTPESSLIVIPLSTGFSSIPIYIISGIAVSTPVVANVTSSSAVSGETSEPAGSPAPGPATNTPISPSATQTFAASGAVINTSSVLVCLGLIVGYFL